MKKAFVDDSFWKMVSFDAIWREVVGDSDVFQFKHQNKLELIL